MASICITGSTDGIGLAAARQLIAAGHEVIVHARSEARGRPVAAGLGSVRLVVGDLAELDEVRELAEALGPVDVLVHNAGVWPRRGTPVSAQGYEPAFAVNALAPHLLTALLGNRVRRRLVFLGSGMVSSGRVDPERLGSARDGARAYADSKAVAGTAGRSARGRRTRATVPSRRQTLTRTSVPSSRREATVASSAAEARGVARRSRPASRARARPARRRGRSAAPPTARRPGRCHVRDDVAPSRPRRRSDSAAVSTRPATARRPVDRPASGVDRGRAGPAPVRLPRGNGPATSDAWRDCASDRDTGGADSTHHRGCTPVSRRAMQPDLAGLEHRLQLGPRPRAWRARNGRGCGRCSARCAAAGRSPATEAPLPISASTSASRAVSRIGQPPSSRHRRRQAWQQRRRDGHRAGPGRAQDRQQLPERSLLRREPVGAGHRDGRQRVRVGAGRGDDQHEVRPRRPAAAVRPPGRRPRRGPGRSRRCSGRCPRRPAAPRPGMPADPTHSRSSTALQGDLEHVGERGVVVDDHDADDAERPLAHVHHRPPPGAAPRPASAGALAQIVTADAAPVNPTVRPGTRSERSAASRPAGSRNRTHHI